MILFRLISDLTPVQHGAVCSVGLRGSPGAHEDLPPTLLLRALLGAQAPVHLRAGGV